MLAWCMPSIYFCIYLSYLLKTFKEFNLRLNRRAFGFYMGLIMLLSHLIRINHKQSLCNNTHQIY